MSLLIDKDESMQEEVLLLLVSTFGTSNIWCLMCMGNKRK